MTADAQSKTRWPIVIVILVYAIALWAWLFVAVVPFDYWVFQLPWWQHIVSSGRIAVFSAPFANYTPPYLYLLSASTLLDGILQPLFTIKLLSVLGVAWLIYAMWRLLEAVAAPRPLEACVWALLLPTLIINAPVLAQADPFWLAPAVLAVAAAIRRRMLEMVLWAGLAFAFKAQAIFLAPFVIVTLVRDRAPIWLWFVPALVYLAAMVPAWTMGWPAADLLTVYLRQAQWHPNNASIFISNAANPWSIYRMAAPSLAGQSFWLGYVLASIATFIYVVRFARLDLSPVQTIAAAALSGTIIPFLLPGMHERFFALGEVLGFCLAWTARDRNSIAAAGLMQLALVSSYFGLRFRLYALPAAGSFFVLAAILLWLDATSEEDRGPVLLKQIGA